GRTGLALLSDVVSDVCVRAGAEADASGLTGVVAGYRFDGPVSARAVLEPLAALHGVDATERGRAIVFRMRGSETAAIDAGRLVEEDGPAHSFVRTGLEGPEPRVRLRYIDAAADHALGVAVSAGGADADVVDVEVAMALDRGQAQRCADAMAE